MLFSPRDQRPTTGDPAATTPDPDRVGRWLQPAALLFLTGCATADGMLRRAAAEFADAYGLQTTLVFDALRRREQAASTALGHGIAVPHARIDGIDEPTILYLRTAQPIPFGAADGESVSHFLVILVPPTGPADDHLRLLAAIAELASSRRFRADLHAAETATRAAEAFRSGIARLKRS